MEISITVVRSYSLLTIGCALLLQGRFSEPLLKLLAKLITRLRRYQFVIPDTEIERHVACFKRLNLLVDVVSPRCRKIFISDRWIFVFQEFRRALERRIFPHCHVAITPIDRAQISQVPVKLDWRVFAVIGNGLRDLWHDQVATVARVAGDCEVPTVTCRIWF